MRRFVAEHSSASSRRHVEAEDAGYVLILTALLLVPLVIAVSFAVDLGSWYAQASKQQRAADAAALAGVVFLPNTANAQAAALAVAAQNGYDSADPDTTVTITNIGNQQMEVNILSDADMYFAGIVVNDFDIEREAIAEYVLPVPLGSPRNFLGTNHLASGSAREDFWVSVAGYCTRREHGDRIASRVDPGSDSSGNFAGCVPGSPFYVGANPEYDANGYFYVIELDDGDATPGEAWPYTPRIDVYHPAMCNAGSPLSENGGGGARQYRFIVRDSDDFDPVQASILSNTLISPSDCGAMPGWTIIDWLPALEGRYFLQIQPVVPAAQGSGDREGNNQMGLRVWNPAWGAANFECTADAIVAIPDAPYRNDCAEVHGYTHLGVYVRGSGGSVSPYLASVGPEHAGKTMEVELYDPAEGMTSVEILDPSGTPVTFTWEVACADSTYQSEVGACTTGENGPVGGYGPVTEAIKDVSGTAGCGNRTWGCYNDQNGRYSGRLLRFQIQLPTLAAEPTWYGGNPWFRIRYTGTNPTDRTTWSVSITGDPVRLVK